MDILKVRNLLQSIDNISFRMRDKIYNEYFDKLGPQNKYVLALFEDAFESTEVFCISMQRAAFSQAGTILRKFVEEAAILQILVTHPEFLPKYIEHYKTRVELEHVSKTDQHVMIAKKYNVPEKYALSYLDYGWIEFKSPSERNEAGMIRYAGFENILPWKSIYLDKLTHSSITSLSLKGDGGDFPIIINFMQIAGFLFDHLCCAFHNFTNFDFNFGEGNLFNNDFIEKYKQFRE